MYSPTQPLPLCWFVTPTAKLVVVAGGSHLDVPPVDREVGPTFFACLAYLFPAAP